MKLDDLNSLEHTPNTKDKDGLFTKVLEELQNLVGDFLKHSSSTSCNRLLESSIYVVRDINNEKLSLVDIQSGQDFNIYVVNSKDKIENLHSKGILNNIYTMSKEDLYSLNLGSNITIKDGKCIPYRSEIKIENSEAAAKLEDMYFCLEQEKNAIYSVSEISDEKIYLTDTKEGGHFSIPKEGYPDFKVGDLIKNINGKYTLI